MSEAPAAHAVEDASRAPVSLQGIVKHYAGHAAVDDVSLDIAAGEIFCLLGESGSGKSTLLRTLAGFVLPDAGRVLLGGEDITAWPPYRRPVNMMFQSYALFPHLDVAGNVRFGLKRDGLAREEIEARLQEVLPLLRLEHLADRRPHQLSGGQQQRVALARCLVKRPRVLLLDEPLAALDRQLRESTQLELLRLQAQLGITFVIVTHDQDEAMTLAHRVGVMRNGRIVQVGTPREVYEKPASRFVAQFVGTVNLFEGRLVRTQDGFIHVHTHDLQDDLLVTGRTSLAEGTTVSVAVRPERMRFLTASDRVDETFSRNAVEATVEQQVFRGDHSTFVVRVADRQLQVSVGHTGNGRDTLPAPGDRVRLAFDPQAACLLTE